jgi:hypothetical protein
VTTQSEICDALIISHTNFATSAGELHWAEGLKETASIAPEIDKLRKPWLFQDYAANHTL